MHWDCSTMQPSHDPEKTFFRDKYWLGYDILEDCIQYFNKMTTKFKIPFFILKTCYAISSSINEQSIKMFQCLQDINSFKVEKWEDIIFHFRECLCVQN